MSVVDMPSSKFPTALYGAVIALAGITLAYQGVSVWLTLHGAMRHYTTHLALILILVAAHHVYLSAIHARSRLNLVVHGVVAGMAALGAAYAGGYLYLNAQALEISQPFIDGNDYIAGFLALAAVLLLTCVIWGWVLATISLAAALYFAFGGELPEPLTGRSFEPYLVMSYLTGMGSPRGIFKYIPLSSDTIFLLVAFGGVLHGTLVIDCFNELGRAIGRIFRGGVSYSAVVASTLIGMVTGQAVANIALSGSMTIPTMKRRGFTAEQSGAIECLASNGSQLVPPIMGLGAFLMAVILGVDYITIVAAGVFPALLYLMVLIMGLSAMIQASPGITKGSETVDWARVGWTLPSFLVSFGVLLTLLYMRYSGAFAGFCGVVLLTVTAFIRPAPYRPSLRQLTEGVVEGVLAGAKLALILAAIGIVAQMLSTTGIGVELGRLMIEVSRESLAFGLILGMFISLIIGMGLPTPAAYALIAIVVVPSLIDLGVKPIAAHFFGFYFAIYSSLTPPVAVGVLTAIRISGGGFMSTAKECIRLGGVGILLPFVFVAFPSVFEFPAISVSTLMLFILTLSASFMMACSLYGVLRGNLGWTERAVLLLGPASFVVYLFVNSIWLGMFAPVLLAGMYIYRRRVGQPLAIYGDDESAPTGGAALAKGPVK